MGRLCLAVSVVLASAAWAQDADAGEAAADAGDAMVIESFEPVATTPAVEQFTVPVGSGISARVYGAVAAGVSMDTKFESPPKAEMAENVAELRLRGSLGVDVKVNDNVRVVLEGRAQFRGATQRDFERTKGFFDAMLGDAYVDLYTPKVDLRVGNQRIAFGANAGLAPADSLNPRDLRESLTGGEPEDSLLPVFAVRAMGEIGRVSVTAVYVPFFTPDKYFVFGQDEALLQPGAEQTVANRRIDPTIEDYVQERILETKRPPPFMGDLALRAVSTGSFKIGASWVWMNEKLPRVTLDPELSALLRSSQSGQPVNAALGASVANRLQAGETLYTGEYLRQHVFSLEGSRVIGPGQLDVDLSFSPRQTFFDASFTPINKSALTWVLGYSQASDSPLLYGINYLGMAVPDVKANEQLFLLEPATAVGANRIGWFHLFAGFVGYTFFDKKLEVTVRGAFEVIGRSFAIAPKVSFSPVDGLKVWAAAEFYEGSPYSALGYFGRNDKVLIGARYELF